jgi:hypothetical protein
MRSDMKTLVDKEYLKYLERIAALAALAAREYRLPSIQPAYGREHLDAHEEAELKDCLFRLLRF